MLSVLLVEDDIDLAATVVQYLELEGIQCDHASNGVSGLHFIANNHYDSLLLDINPYEYIRDVLLRVSSHPASRLEELLPQRWAPPP